MDDYFDELNPDGLTDDEIIAIVKHEKLDLLDDDLELGQGRLGLRQVVTSVRVTRQTRDCRKIRHADWKYNGAK